MSFGSTSSAVNERLGHSYFSRLIDPIQHTTICTIRKEVRTNKKDRLLPVKVSIEGEVTLRVCITESDYRLGEDCGIGFKKTNRWEVKRWQKRKM